MQLTPKKPGIPPEARSALAWSSADLGADRRSSMEWLETDGLAFADAHFRVLGRTPETRRTMLAWLAGLKAHVAEAGVGSISEVFDGDDPQIPRGCFAQARSVAEIARILYTHLN